MTLLLQAGGALPSLCLLNSCTLDSPCDGRVPVWRESWRPLHYPATVQERLLYQVLSAVGTSMIISCLEVFSQWAHGKGCFSHSWKVAAFFFFGPFFRYHANFPPFLLWLTVQRAYWEGLEFKDKKGTCQNELRNNTYSSTLCTFLSYRTYQEIFSVPHKDPERKGTDGGPHLTCLISISLKCLAQMIFLSTEI